MSDYSGGGYGGNDARIQNIESQIATLFRWAGTVTRAHNALAKQVGDIMSDTQTTHDEIAELTTDVAQNQADEQAMSARIDALVAAGKPLSAEDATALKAALGALEQEHTAYTAASTPATATPAAGGTSTTPASTPTSGSAGSATPAPTDGGTPTLPASPAPAPTDGSGSGTPAPAPAPGS